MIEVSAKVINVDGDNATVRVDSQGGCGRCHEPGGCGGTHLTQIFWASPKELTVPNAARAMIGEDVVVSLSDAAFFRGVVAGYCLPLLGVLLGAVVGHVFFGDTGSVVCSLLGFLGAWGGVRRFGLCKLDLMADLKALRRKK